VYPIGRAAFRAPDRTRPRGSRAPDRRAAYLINSTRSLSAVFIRVILIDHRGVALLAKNGTALSPLRYKFEVSRLTTPPINDRVTPKPDRRVLQLVIGDTLNSIAIDQGIEVFVGKIPLLPLIIKTKPDDMRMGGEFYKIPPIFPLTHPIPPAIASHRNIIVSPPEVYRNRPPLTPERKGALRKISAEIDYIGLVGVAAAFYDDGVIIGNRKDCMTRVSAALRGFFIPPYPPTNPIGTPPGPRFPMSRAPGPAAAGSTHIIMIMLCIF